MAKKALAPLVQNHLRNCVPRYPVRIIPATVKPDPEGPKPLRPPLRSAPTYMTTVHIASQPEGPIQKCFRCERVLVDGRGAMSTDGHGVTFWGPGKFVGVVAGNPECSFLMDRDADPHQADERRCV